jgi:CelD/BcsL family acetyltransferase involved in cellulose biosynthesis
VYGGLITDDSTSAIKTVEAHLAELIASRSVDLVTINALPIGHELSAHFAAAQVPWAIVSRDAMHRHWVFSFADGPFANTINRFSRKHRYNLRRSDRRLAEQFDERLELDCTTRSDQVDGFLRESDAIVASSYQRSFRRHLKEADPLNAALHAAATTGRLRCYLLRADGRAIAFQKGVIDGDTYWLLSTAFDPRHRDHSPGQVLLVRVMKDLHAAGVRRIDYGFGDARYKRIYGTECRMETTIRLYARGITARLVHCEQRFIDTMLSRVGSCTLSPWLRRAWRQRLERREHDSSRGGVGQ